MSRKLFLTILAGMRDYDPYLRCRPDDVGKFGFTSYQKCYVAIRKLSYGVAALGKTGLLFSSDFLMMDIRLAFSLTCDGIFSGSDLF
jgi:hypothetical protein